MNDFLEAGAGSADGFLFGYSYLIGTGTVNSFDVCCGWIVEWERMVLIGMLFTELLLW